MTTFAIYAPVPSKGHQKMKTTAYKLRRNAEKAAEKYGPKALVVPVRQPN